MTVLSLRVEANQDSSKYFRLFARKTEERSMIKNPFKIGMLMIKHEKERLILLDIEPVWPRFWLFGFLLFFAALILAGWSWWLLPGVVLLLPGLLWTPLFYYLMLLAGKKKNGLRFRMKLLSPETALRRVIVWVK